MFYESYLFPQRTDTVFDFSVVWFELIEIKHVVPMGANGWKTVLIYGMMTVLTADYQVTILAKADAAFNLKCGFTFQDKMMFLFTIKDQTEFDAWTNLSFFPALSHSVHWHDTLKNVFQGSEACAHMLPSLT